MKFTEILDQYNIPQAPEHHRHGTEGWVQFDCPFCGPNSQRFHMGFHLISGHVNCWKCGGKNLFEVLREITGGTHKHVHQLISDLDSVIVPLEEPLRHLELPPGLHPLGVLHRQYLTKRGLIPNEIETLWKVQATPIYGRMPWRLFIPIHHQGRLVSWTSRAIGNSKRRYISAKSHQELIPHKHLLYGADFARHTAIVVEGPVDVWKIGPGAVATFGTSYTKKQFTHLLEFPRRVICFDNEPLAQRQAKHLCYELAAFPGETLNLILDGKDPAETSAKKIKKIRKKFLD
jgi:hypothetical protein